MTVVELRDVSTRQRVVKLWPNIPPARGDRILVNGFPYRVTRCRLKWDGRRWTIRSLRAKKEAVAK